MRCEKSCTITVNETEKQMISDIMSILMNYNSVGIYLDNGDIVSVLMAIAKEKTEVIDGDGEVIEGIKVSYEEEENDEQMRSIRDRECFGF